MEEFLKPPLGDGVHSNRDCSAEEFSISTKHRNTAFQISLPKWSPTQRARCAVTLCGRNATPLQRLASVMDGTFRYQTAFHWRLGVDIITTHQLSLEQGEDKGLAPR